MPVIEIEGLRKEYRRLRGGTQIAVDGLNLSVPQGGVYGFLGPNGSGKTTTIRCALGLVGTSAGRVQVLGADVPRGLPEVMAKVGSLVESPVAFPNFSGRKNLQILATAGGISRNRVEHMLELVGLADRGNDAARTYSLGMRQRLGIAAALLKDPELLILDEPANGLDPAGIVEIRELVKSLGAEGRTVFVSSHLLGEIQLMCDRVAILTRGKCIAEGPVDEILSHGSAPRIVVKVPDPTAALEVLVSSGMPAHIDADTVLVQAPNELSTAEASAQINKALANQGIYLSGIWPEAIDLESVFLQLTGEPHHLEQGVHEAVKPPFQEVPTP